MQELGRYILSITSAAVIVGILSGIVDQKSAAGSMIRLIGALILTLSVIRPVIRFDWDYLADFAGYCAADADVASANGAEVSRDAMAEIIKSETEAYILDKAQHLHAQLTVSVTLSQDWLPVPAQVSVQGDISPYGKAHLQQIIESELNIPKENQTWIGASSEAG